MFSRLPDAFGTDSSTKYFSLATLLFIASFLILPSSKMVNNVYYLLLAIPAAVLLPRVLAARAVSWAGGLWMVFLGYFAMRGVAAGDFSFLKHVMYVGLFVLVLGCFTSMRLFESSGLVRVLFWASAAYVALNAMWLWLSGQAMMGERIIWLSGRMAGPIYTSMWLALCFGLCVSAWLRERRRTELVAALFIAWFLCGYILQSRSGLVGLAICLVPLLYAGVMHMRHHPRALLMVVLAGFAAGYLLLTQVPMVSSLWARGDSYRLELWQSYAAMLSRCGMFQGCGVGQSPMIELASGMVINHPHNVYLSLALYGGALGVALFSILMAVLLASAFKRRSIWGFALMLGLIMVNFDGHRVLDSPNELWLLLLLPAGLLSRSPVAAEANAWRR